MARGPGPKDPQTHCDVMVIMTTIDYDNYNDNEDRVIKILTVIFINTSTIVVRSHRGLIFVRKQRNAVTVFSSREKRERQHKEGKG